MTYARHELTDDFATDVRILVVDMSAFDGSDGFNTAESRLG